MVNKFVQSVLLSLCANYPPSNDTVTEPPPWQWGCKRSWWTYHFSIKLKFNLSVSEKRQTHLSNSSEFQCILKTNEDIWQHILRGKRLRVGTLPDQPPLSWVTVGENNTLKGHGIAFEILNTLSDKFGFSYEVFIPSIKTMINIEGSILNMLIRREVDMVAAFIPILPSLDRELQWGMQLTHFEYLIMMKRPKESATGSGLLAPFEIEVWFLILISLIVVGPVIHGIMKLRSSICGGSKVYPLSSCIWFVYGALMKQGSSLSPDNDSTRIMFASWWLFIMILTSFYTANLTAFLTLSRFTLPVHSVDDIANPINQWAALEGDAIEYSVKNGTDLAPLRHSWNNGKGSFISSTDHSYIESLVSRGVLLLHERNWLNYFMLNIERGVTNEKERCRYVLTSTTYLTRSLSFAFPKHSVLPHLFNEDLLLYVESGIIKHLLTKDLPEAVICPLNLGSKERQLRNSDLFTTYAIVVIGFILALIVFVFEISRKFYHRQLPTKKTKNTKTVRWAREPKLVWYSDVALKKPQESIISSDKMDRNMLIYINNLLYPEI